jgi:hypothetical protein
MDWSLNQNEPLNVLLDGTAEITRALSNIFRIRQLGMITASVFGIPMAVILSFATYRLGNDCRAEPTLHPERCRMPEVIMYQAVQQKIATDKVLKAHFLADGVEQPIGNFRVFYDKPGFGDYQLHLREYQNAKYGKILVTLSQSQVKAFFDLFEDNNFTFSTYRNVKNIQAWKECYGYKQSLVEYINKNGAQRTAMEWVVPCRVCGLVTHEKLITVDHQNPQKGGENNAILKVFRGLGLTMTPPTGVKAGVVLKNLAASVGGLSGTADGGKYRLNPAGTLYYSIIKAAGQLKTLREKCIHSYLNLSPLCAHCNSSKNNNEMEF